MSLEAPHATTRSTDAEDYQALPCQVAAMAKSFAPGDEVAPHAHARDQLLYAVSGLMRLQTDRETWVVPPGRAIYIPGGVVHAVYFQSMVEMRTLYILPEPERGLPSALTVLEVSNLMRELILALIEEPVVYEEEGRGGAIARLILTEIARAPELSLFVPLPKDPRLRRLCDALLADPASRLTLESWSNNVGASPRTLARLFDREVGLSFGEWRQRVRFHNALDALSRGEAVARVASRHGYNSTSAFSAAFRKVMGRSPSQFRE